MGSVIKHKAEPMRPWSNQVHLQKKGVSRQTNHLEHWLIGRRTPFDHLSAEHCVLQKWFTKWFMYCKFGSFWSHLDVSGSMCLLQTKS
jgi:hypothetical protein